MKALPTTTYKKVTYVIDRKLREFRPMDRPFDPVKFDSELGREIDGRWGDNAKTNRLESQKKWFIEILKEWDMTFEEDTDIPELIARIERREGMTTDNLDELIFHLWQIAHGDMLKIE